MSKIEEEFRSLGRTKKVEFIDDNIRYASASAVAEYVETYIYDVCSSLEVFCVSFVGYLQVS